MKPNKQNILQDRINGLSYKDIMSKYGLSKSKARYRISRVSGEYNEFLLSQKRHRLDTLKMYRSPLVWPRQISPNRIKLEYPYSEDWRWGYLAVKNSGTETGRKNVSLYNSDRDLSLIHI